MRKLRFALMLLFVSNIKTSKAITIKDTFVQVNNLSIDRKNVYVNLPDSLGGNKTSGFAVIRLTYDKNLRLTKVSLLKLHTLGTVKIDYAYPGTLTKITARYLPFLKNHAEKQKITRGDGELQKENEITFIVRFGQPPVRRNVDRVINKDRL